MTFTQLNLTVLEIHYANFSGAHIPRLPTHALHITRFCFFMAF
jgi:hypothetical protein